MNLILFDEGELESPLPNTDPRLVHIRRVLRLADGAEFDAGLIAGPRGKANIQQAKPGLSQVSFRPTHPATPLTPIDVIVGLSRPQTCRILLRSLTSMGVQSIEFVRTERGEASYASSKLWTSGESDALVRAATSQAFDTTLPTIRVGRSLAQATLDAVEQRIALDNYEPAHSLAAVAPSSGPVAVFIGAERGWSDAEREQLRRDHCLLAGLGPRVLRVEVAAVSAVAVLLSQRAGSEPIPTPSSR